MCCAHPGAEQGHAATRVGRPTSSAEARRLHAAVQQMQSRSAATTSVGLCSVVPSRQPPSLPQGDGPSKRGEPRAEHNRASAASRIPCRGGVAVARAVRPGRARASWSNDVHGTSQNMNVSMAMCRSVAVRPILPRNAFGHDPPDGRQVERIISADWRTRLLSWEECRRVWTRCELRGRGQAEAVGGDWTGTTPHATKPPKPARATRHDTSDRSRIPRSARYRA
jgi:hypothetical protein